MRDDELTHDWLEFLAEQKSVRRSLKEIMTSRCPPEYPLSTSDASEKWSNLWGNICYNEGPSGSGISIDPNWIEENITTINLADRQVKVNKKIATILPKAYEAAVEATEKQGRPYRPRVGGRRGPWSPRHVQLNGVKPGISGHSWGMAIDFDVEKNDPDKKQNVINEHPEFINAMKEYGFAWGGVGFDDPMHFYYAPGEARRQELFSLSSVIARREKPKSEKNVASAKSKTEKNVASAQPKPEIAVASGKQKDQASATLPKKRPFVWGITENKKISGDSLFKIFDESKNKIYKKHKKYFISLLNHLKKELKLTKPVKIVLEEDEENGKKVLGRTGGYINHEDKIHIFCSGRHIKDIMRSLAHELVHPRQNIRGEFKDHHKTSHGYAQTDKHLRAMEKEAYLKGNILFRDWEDNYKYREEK